MLSFRSLGNLKDHYERDYTYRAFVKQSVLIRFDSVKLNNKRGTFSELRLNADFAVQLLDYVLTNVQSETIAIFIALLA